MMFKFCKGLNWLLRETRDIFDLCFLPEQDYIKAKIHLWSMPQNWLQNHQFGITVNALIMVLNHQIGITKSPIMPSLLYWQTS